MFGEYEDTHQKANFPDGEMLQGGDGGVLEKSGVSWLCNLGEDAWPLWAFIASFVKLVIVKFR